MLPLRYFSTVKVVITLFYYRQGQRLLPLKFFFTLLPLQLLLCNFSFLLQLITVTLLLLFTIINIPLRYYYVLLQ